jgi:hypothetical protein
MDIKTELHNLKTMVLTESHISDLSKKNIADRIFQIEKGVVMNYIPCCEELNPDFEIGEQVLLTKRTIVTIETFCEDGMIEIDDNNEYYKVDKDELTKRV